MSRTCAVVGASILACIWTAYCMGAAAASRPASPYDSIQFSPRNAAPATRPAASAGEGLGFWRIGLALALVVALILALKWAGQRMLGLSPATNPGGPVRVLARATLGPRHQLMLVLVGRRILLLGNSGTHISSLGEITDPAEVAELIGQSQRPAAGEPQRSVFSALFSRAEAGFDEPGTGTQGAIPADGFSSASRPEDTAIQSMRSELGELSQKIRTMVRQFGRG